MSFSCSTEYNDRPFQAQFTGTQLVSAVQLSNCHMLSEFVFNCIGGFFLAVSFCWSLSLLVHFGIPKRMQSVRDVMLAMIPFISGFSFVAFGLYNFHFSSDCYHETYINVWLGSFFIHLSSLCIVISVLHVVFHALKNAAIATYPGGSAKVQVIGVVHLGIIAIYFASTIFSFLLQLVLDRFILVLIHLSISLFVVLYTMVLLLCAVWILRSTLANLTRDLGLESSKFEKFFNYSLSLCLLSAIMAGCLVEQIIAALRVGDVSYFRATYYNFGELELFLLPFATGCLASCWYISSGSDELISATARSSVIGTQNFSHKVSGRILSTKKSIPAKKSSNVFHHHATSESYPVSIGSAAESIPNEYPPFRNTHSTESSISVPASIDPVF